MADRWEIREQGDGSMQVHRNGSWFSDVEDEMVGRALVRAYRASEVVLVDPIGYRRTVKP